MPVLEVPRSNRDRVRHLVRPLACSEWAPPSLGTHEATAWDQVCRKLRAWEVDPAELDDDGVEPPTADTVRLALTAAGGLRENGVDAPGTVVPNGDGGISFRWRTGETTWTVEIEDDGAIESSLLFNGKLVSQHSLLGGARD